MRFVESRSSYHGNQNGIALAKEGGPYRIRGIESYRDSSGILPKGVLGPLFVFSNAPL